MEIIKKEISDMVYEIINEPLVEKRKLLCQINGLDYDFVVNYGPIVQFDHELSEDKKAIIQYYMDAANIHLTVRHNSFDQCTSEFLVPFKFVSEYTLQNIEYFLLGCTALSYRLDMDVDDMMDKIRNIIESA
jgi:hypothetical protein